MALNTLIVDDSATMRKIIDAGDLRIDVHFCDEILLRG